jgi:mannose-6-phosphate isomerase-like protein (cupin superfamily)
MNKHLVLGVMVSFATMATAAQEAALQGFQYWSHDSLKTLEQSLSTQAASNPHHIATGRLQEYPNDLFMLAHREADGVVEWHETQADIFYVQSGSATLIVGGTMVGGDTVELHERRNGTIQGGTRVRLLAGDIVRIPPKMPHQILLEGSKEFTYFVIKVKGY